MADEMIIQEISQEIEDLNELLNPQGDLISRESMISELRQMYNEARKLYDDAPQLSKAEAKAETRMATLVEMKMRVMTMPSAERTGTWLVAKGACEPDYMECNKCGWITEYYGGLEEEWNYCPHCGARMERD